MTRKEQVSNGFTEMMKGFWGNQDLEVPDFKEPCGDAISRILKRMWNCRGEHTTSIDKVKMEQIIRDELLSVTPKPKTGHWIETAEEYYKAINEKGGGVDEDTPYFIDDIACSECLAKFSVIDNETERFIYCPNCGAKMEVGKNE